ncbi:glycosyltransferase [Dietzia cinnamea]|uniref:glycosyltransferase n=1 Tax=Dietzia cinnamea TaxID=321318 RepID=UPI0031F2F68D
MQAGEEHQGRHEPDRTRPRSGQRWTGKSATGQGARVVRAARVVVTPYLRASQSGVVHLAFSHARPVVSTDVGDLAEAVHDGESGLLVPPGDVAALARALERLLVDPALAERLGARGHADLARTGAEAARLVSDALDRCGADAGAGVRAGAGRVRRGRRRREAGGAPVCWSRRWR